MSQTVDADDIDHGQWYSQLPLLRPPLGLSENGRNGGVVALEEVKYLVCE